MINTQFFLLDVSRETLDVSGGEGEVKSKASGLKAFFQ